MERSFRQGQVRLLVPLLVAVAFLTVLAGAWWWRTFSLPRVSDTAHEIDGLIRFVLTVAAVFLVASHLYLAYTLWRFRERVGGRAAYLGTSRRSWLPILAVVAVLFGFDLAFDHKSNHIWGKIFFRLPPDPFVVEVTGEQFAWAIRYPGKDGKLGRTDPRLITDDNPLGIDKTDPASKDDIFFPAGQGELRLPLNRPVLLLLRSKDTLHSFYFPAARIKMDAVPGMTTRIWFTPKVAGRYEFVCAELCGLGHYRMRGEVVVEPLEDLQKWLAEQPTFADLIP